MEKWVEILIVKFQTFPKFSKPKVSKIPIEMYRILCETIRFKNND